jgi:DNA polymerase-1
MADLSFQGFRFADYIQSYKSWAKLCEHIQKLIDSEIQGKIHANFNIRGTETGRFSCNSPNLQQIPSKTKASVRLRKAFTGNLIVADYSNVELRLLAHFSGDRKLLEVYRPGGIGDLHKAVADELGIERRIAKTINFGISYGMGSKKLASDLRISQDQARDYIARWEKAYPEVKKWKKMIERTICKYGYVSCMGGTRRRFNVKPYLYDYGSEVGIKPSCIKEYYSAIREGINFVIQGSSAHITKLAIEALADERIVLQVHDEIVIENPKRTREEIQKILDGVVHCKCPITAEVKQVKSWGEAK